MAELTIEEARKIYVSSLKKPPSILILENLRDSISKSQRIIDIRSSCITHLSKVLIESKAKLPKVTYTNLIKNAELFRDFSESVVQLRKYEKLQKLEKKKINQLHKKEAAYVQ